MRTCLTKISRILNAERCKSVSCPEDACPQRFSWFFYWIPKVQKCVNGSHETEKRDILQFLIILAEQIAICTSRHSHFFDSVQPLLALSAQRALCTFFSLLLQATLLRCGLMVSSPGPCASSGGRLPEAFFLVFRLAS